MNENPSYELFEELGEGSHTVVYRGYDLNLGRDVAIKQLDETSRRDVRRADQFLQEASFLAQFEHENVLRIYSVDKEQAWIVMELMKGTLASQIQESALPPDTVRSVMRQILGALDFLHGKQKVHGAVRPSNILINDQGIVKLSDFEAANHDGELRAPTGSKKHLAPELIRPELGEFGPTADLYCLGFTALELLAGPKFHSFFPGTGDDAIDADVAWLRWHSSEESLPSVKKLCPHVPDDMARVIDALLSKHPKDRPQAAQELLDQLADQTFIPVLPAAENPAAPSAPARSATSQVKAIDPERKVRLAQTRPAHDETGSRKRKSSPNTKDRVNAFLGKPFILWPLCAAMLGGAVWIGLRLQDSDPVAPPFIEKPIQLATVRVAVNTDDAQVTIKGQSPPPDAAGVYELPKGEYELSVSKTGYANFYRTFTVGDQDQTIQVDLEPIPSLPAITQLQLEVLPDARNLQVFVDGVQVTSETDGSFKIAQGTRQLRLTKTGYEDFEKTVVLKDAIQNVPVLLREKPTVPSLANVAILITPNPEGAMVFIDGQPQQASSEGTYRLTPGNHQLRVTKAGFEDFDQMTAIELSTERLLVDLRPVTPSLQLGQLRVKLGPESSTADVRIDGEERATNSEGVFDLDPGRYELAISQPGFRDHSQEVTMAAGELKELEIILQPLDSAIVDPDIAALVGNPLDELETMFVNADELAEANAEKTAALAEQFSGDAELVIDSGGFLEEVTDVSFSPDGQLLAAAGGKVVRVWSVETGELLATLRGDRSRTTYGDCFAVKFSPDGKHLIVGINDYRNHGSIREYATADFSEIKRLIPGHAAPCRKLRFSQAGTRISADADGNLLITEASTGQVRTTIKASDPSAPLFDVIDFPDATEEYIFVLDFEGPKVLSPQGKPLGPDDEMPESIRSWFRDAFTGQIQYPTHTAKDPRVLDFAMEQGVWAAAGVAKKPGSNQFWAAIYPTRGMSDAGALAPQQVYTGHQWSITCMEIGPANQWVATGDKFGEIHVWNRQTGQLLRRFRGQGKSIYEVAFDRNSNRIAFGTRPFKPGVWNRNHYGDADQVLDLRQRAIIRRNAADRLQLEHEQAQRGGLTVDVSRESNQAAYRIQLKNQNDVLAQYRISSGRNPAVYSLLADPHLDVSTPVVFGDNEGLLALWDTSGSALRRAFVGHKSMVTGISVSRNGKLLISASTDRTIRIWSLENYLPTGTFDFRYQSSSVIQVPKNSSSAQAGVQVGDEIVSMDGMSIKDIYERMLARDYPYRPGQIVPVTMKRQGREYQYNMTMDQGYDLVEPSLSFFVGDDGQWILWSPRGYYDASPGADQLIGWHVNRGPTKSARFFEAQQFQDQLYRPDIIDQLLDGLSVEEAVRRANAIRQEQETPRDFRSPQELAANHPPEVSILEPLAGTPVTSSSVKLHAIVNSPNGLPVQEVTLLQNGHVAKVFQPQDLRSTEFDVTHDLSLLPGRNRIEIVASNAKASSAASAVELVYQAAAPPQTTDAYVLAIGISTHQEPTDELRDLPFARSDAAAFARAVKSQEGGKLYRNVRVRLLTDQQATRTNILDAFQWLVDQVQPHDAAMIYFAGHGFVDTSDNFYLATHEADTERPRATTVSWRQFTTMLHEDLPACSRFVFLDARPTAGGIRPGMRNPLLDLAAPELGTTFFASSTLQQTTLDVTKGNQQQGVFLQAIADTLSDRSTDRMPTPPDQLINAVELAASVKQRVQRASVGRQIPTFYASRALRRHNLLELSPQARSPQK